MASIEISEHDQRIICEATEDALRNNEGRTRCRVLWGYIEATRPELAEIRKSYGKKSDFCPKVVAIMLEWQQKHPSKIGYKKIGKQNWLWYDGTIEMPQPSSITKSMAKKPVKKVTKNAVGKTTPGNIKQREAQAKLISDADKKVICEEAEKWLDAHRGRTRLSQLCVFMKKECHRVLEIYMRYKKEGHAIGFGVYHTLNLWQAANPQKIGRTILPEPQKDTAWFWYGGGTEPPLLSDREKTKASGSEMQFYAPFAKWLEERKECSKAISTGDKRGKKWSCPDVVGIKKLTKFGGPAVELVSAEIKTNTSPGEIITGFGQACAYKLFSHKTYLVVPMDSNEAELHRVKELCEQCDVGLVVFDKTNPDKPAFDLRHSAKPCGNPNPAYVNDSIKELLKKEDYDIF